MSSALNKTAGTSVLALQVVNANTVVISSALDVATKMAARICIHFGRVVTNALSASVKFRIEGSSRAAGDGHWYTLAEFQTLIAAAESEAVNGVCASGQNVIPLASTSNIVVGNILFINNGTIGNSEWGRTKVVTGNTSATIEDNLVNAQTGSTVYNQGEFFSAIIPLDTITRLRLVVDASGSGYNTAVESDMVTCDSIG